MVQISLASLTSFTWVRVSLGFFFFLSFSELSLHRLCFNSISMTIFNCKKQALWCIVRTLHLYTFCNWKNVEMIINICFSSSFSPNLVLIFGLDLQPHQFLLSKCPLEERFTSVKVIYVHLFPVVLVLLYTLPVLYILSALSACESKLLFYLQNM